MTGRTNIVVIEVGVQGLLADRYQVQELLGRGAMGEVWRAVDQILGRPVAVKLLRADGAADAERFRLEAQTAARLNHRNVVGVYDFGSHHGQLYLVMELLDGWSLAQEVPAAAGHWTLVLQISIWSGPSRTPVGPHRVP